MERSTTKRGHRKLTEESCALGVCILPNSTKRLNAKLCALQLANLQFVLRVRLRPKLRRVRQSQGGGDECATDREGEAPRNWAEGVHCCGWMCCGVKLFGGENGRRNLLRAEDGMGDDIWGSGFWRQLPRRRWWWENVDKYLEIETRLKYKL